MLLWRHSHWNFSLFKPHMHPLIHLPDPSLSLLPRSLFSARCCLNRALGLADTCRTEPTGWMRLNVRYFGIALPRIYRHPVCGPADSPGLPGIQSALYGLLCSQEFCHLQLLMANWEDRRAYILRGATAYFSRHLAVCREAPAPCCLHNPLVPKDLWNSLSPEHHSISWFHSSPEKRMFFSMCWWKGRAWGLILTKENYLWRQRIKYCVLLIPAMAET